MRTKILPDSALAVIKRNALVYTALRTVRMQGGRFVPPRTVAGVPGRVHFNDFMLTSEADAMKWYVGGAQNVIGLLEEGLAAAGRSFADLRTILDFGSGYGRVVRLLVDHVEPRRIFVTDVIREGVAFCASEFGVNPIYPPRGGGIPVLPPMDLIYAISVLTHLPAGPGEDVLRAWAGSVEPGGLLIFTTQGPATVADPGRYGIDDARSRELAARLESDGFAYAPYDHYLGDDYGMAWLTPERVAQLAATCLPGFRQIAYRPVGLDDHQDVYVYVRESGGPAAAS